MTVFNELENYEDLVLYEDESSEDSNFTVHKGYNCLCFLSGNPGNLLERYPENIRTYVEYILTGEEEKKLFEAIHGEEDPVKALKDTFNKPDGYLKLERICKENDIHLRIILMQDIRI